METNGNKMETLKKGEEGNTNLPPKRVVPFQYWCFTHYAKNNLEMETLETILKRWKYIFGEEICPTTGRFHLQGYVDFLDKKRPIETVRIKEIHWTKCNGTKKQNIDYCSKEGKVHTNMEIEEPLEDPMQGLTLYKWQEDILNLIKTKPDKRTIHWYWEPTGNIGKTSISKHICMNYNAIVLSGKGTDVKAGVVAHLKERKNNLKVCIFHYVRSQEEFISYESLESIKDGMFFSGKYESSMALFNSPHVIVMANFEPNINKLSIDRWNICKIE